MASSSSEPVKPEGTPEVEKMYRTKIITFLGRTTPIIIEDVGGPTPFIALCNILLLKNKLGLSPDVKKKVSQERLFKLVSESLIASKDNNKAEGSVNNQLQRIADAMDMVPSFATSLDVNLRFKSVEELEVTREQVVFDLLDIPVYHGWIVDPQDSDTYNAFGSKCYNTVMEELYDLETKYKDAFELVETTNPDSNVDNSGPNIRDSDEGVTLETDPGEDISSSVEVEKASQGGQVNPSESSKHESKDGIELTRIGVGEKTEKPDGDSSGPGEDVRSSLEADNTSHGGSMNTSESQKPVKGSSAHHAAALQLLKDMTDDTTVEHCMTIEIRILKRKFLRGNGTQLSQYGLFRLQKDLKEGELCAFFRYGLFFTMYKFGGELYTLVTEQGYIDSPGHVWEKLNEVYGDIWWADADFKCFKEKCEIEEVGSSSDENNENNENNAYEDMTDLATVFEKLVSANKKAEEGNISLISDLLLAQALQRREYAEQHVMSQRLPSATFPSGFIVGPEREYSPLPPRKLLPRTRSLLARTKEIVLYAKKLKERCRFEP